MGQQNQQSGTTFSNGDQINGSLQGKIENRPGERSVPLTLTNSKMRCTLPHSTEGGLMKDRDRAETVHYCQACAKKKRDP